MTDPRYAVVRCSRERCRFARIVDTSNETATCPVCPASYTIASRKFLARSDSQAELRDELGRLNQDMQRRSYGDA